MYQAHTPQTIQDRLGYPRWSRPSLSPIFQTPRPATTPNDESGQDMSKHLPGWPVDTWVEIPPGRHGRVEANVAALWWELGFDMGMGKPAVFPKWVARVRVWFSILAHRDTPRTHTAVSRVFMFCYSKVSLMFFVLNNNFFSFFLINLSPSSLCHNVTWPMVAVWATRPSFAFLLPPPPYNYIIK